MANKAANIYSDGVTQGDRFLKRLSPDTLPIDSRTINGHLLFIFDMAREANFYDSANTINGDWGAFFREENIFALAHVARERPDTESKENERYATLLSKGGYDTFDRRLIVKKTFDNTYKIAQRINEWYMLFSKCMEKDDFFSEIEAAITGHLEKSLKELRQIFYLLPPGWIPEEYTFAEFHYTASPWQIGNESKYSFSKEAAELTEEGISKSLTKLEAVLWGFYKTQTYLRSLARKKLNAKLSTGQVSPDKYKPHVALLLTFLHLVEQHAQPLVNNFTKKHLDFYYENILGTTLLPAKPDIAFIIFELNKGAQPVVIPLGSPITGGKDANNKEILFSTVDNIEVNNVSIKYMANVFFEKGRPYEVNKGRPASELLVTGIYTSTFQPGSGQPWAPFGENEMENSATMAPGCLGFAVSSPALAPKEGARTIDIVITFEPGSMQKLLALLQKETGDNDINGLLGNAFNFYITTAQKWLGLPDAFFIANIAGNSIAASFPFSAADEPITAFEAKTHHGNFITAWPVLKALLNDGLPPYAYSFLSVLAIKDIHISASASNIKPEALYNNYGKIDGSKPFQPFGPIATCGSYLLAGSNEMAQKRITSATFGIEWFGLPENGFFDYYGAYAGADIQNDTFKIDGTVLGMQNDFGFVKKSLFSSQTSDTKGKLSNKSEILFAPGTPGNIIAQPGTWVAAPVPAGPGNNKLSGYYCIQLTAPSFAFCSSTYAQAMSSVVINNSTVTIKQANGTVTDKDVMLPLPNPPYIPTIQSITYSYTAVDHFSVEENGAHATDITVKLFHITPLWEYAVSPRHSPSPSTEQEYSNTLLPYFDKQGYLFICLEGLLPFQTVQLFFNLHSSYAQSTNSIISTISWDYLAKDGIWRKLEINKQVVDGTDNFIKPGIVKLKLPDGITFAHNIMPEGYWVRLSVYEVAGTLSKIINVQPQATCATRVLGPGASMEHIGKLPPGTLNKLVSPIPQVKQLMQPQLSFGGRGTESPENYYTRISERLRHKGRCITSWDYERMVLQEFPDVFYARCIAHAKPPDVNKPGNVTLVVIQDMGSQDKSDCSPPKLDMGKLFCIKTYIGNLSAPPVVVHVFNPEYVYVKAICSVTFTNDSSNIFYMQQLKAHINNYLSPWKTHGSMQYNTGPVFNTYNMLTTIIKLAYVSAVGEDFSICLSLEDGSELPYGTSLLPWQFFAPAGTHDIAISEGSATDSMSNGAGINKITVGKDFKIS